MPRLPGGYVTCSLGPLGAGASATVTATAIPTEALLPGIFYNTIGTSGLRTGNIVQIETPVYLGDAGSSDDTNNNVARVSFEVIRAGWSLPSEPGVTTPAGNNVHVQLGDPFRDPLPITLDFASVTQAGLSSAVPVLGTPLLPANFQVNGTAYDIRTTAQYTPPVTVCFGGDFTASSRILHYDASSPSCDVTQPSTCWVPLPNQQLSPAGSGPYTRICGTTTTFSPFVIADSVNRPPTADAGLPRTVEAAGPGGALVQFAGAGDDPDGDPLTYTWSGPCGAGIGAGLRLQCPIGVSTMTLRVTDGAGLSATATVTVTVRDTTPPLIQCNAPTTITPADAPITFTSRATDLVDPRPTVSVTGFDCYAFNGSGQRIDKKDSCKVRLTGAAIAILDSGGVGTTITWNAQAIDSSKNVSTALCTVGVVNPVKK